MVGWILTFLVDDPRKASNIFNLDQCSLIPTSCWHDTACYRFPRHPPENPKVLWMGLSVMVINWDGIIAFSKFWIHVFPVFESKLKRRDNLPLKMRCCIYRMRSVVLQFWRFLVLTYFLSFILNCGLWRILLIPVFQPNGSFLYFSFTN